MTQLSELDNSELNNARDLVACLDKHLRIHYPHDMKSLTIQALHGDDEYWSVAFRDENEKIITAIDIEHKTLDVDFGKTMFREAKWELIRKASCFIIQGFLCGRGKI